MGPATVFTCNTCHRLLTVKICRNGNAGRAFTCCYKKHANNAHCDFFAWVDPTLSPPSSRFASSSPASSSPCPVATVPSVQAPTPATQNPSSTSLLLCSMVDCTTMRLHPACTRKMCCRHCLEAGGCHGTKTHICETPGPLASDKGK
jgi:hypothetical protein